MKNNAESKGSRKSGEDVYQVLLQIKSCISISDLCSTAGLTMFRSEKQLVCNLCDDASENIVRRAGVFHYDFDIEGGNFKEINLPSKFRYLKKSICEHINSKSPKAPDTEHKEKDKFEENLHLYNHKVGPKVGKMIY